MKRSYYNQSIGRMFFPRAAALIFAAVLMTPLAYADDKPRITDTHNEQKIDKIHITADKLIVDDEARYAEFIGNVKATQQNTVITADRLKIFYRKGPDTKENPFASEESINKIVANGNVKIKFDNRVAMSQQAVYITGTMVLILSGTDSKIISGKESISGEKITLYRKDGRINVESGSEKRVEALFYSKEKIIN